MRISTLFLILFFQFITISCAQLNQNPQESPTQLHKENSETFKNPLLRSGPDPWVLKREGKYYYMHTTGNTLKLRETERMEDLGEAEPLVIWSPPEGTEYSQHIWAPEIHYLDGKWYVYYAATYDDGTEHSMDRNRRMFALENSSDSPMNTNWVFKGKVADQADHWAIDGTVMEQGGERYFIWSGWRGKNQPQNTGRQQLYIAKMSNPWTLKGERVMISEPEYEWERNGLVNEGPVAWENPYGETFLFYSGSGCWTDEYKIGALKLVNGSDPLDPHSWEKHSKPLFQKSIQNKIFAPGHNSFFNSPDETEDWILYHANDRSGDGCGGRRKPRMQKIRWDESGFPVLGTPVSTNSEIKVPSSK